MGSYQSLAHALYAFEKLGSSRHRPARVLRFIFKHPEAHAKVVRQLHERDRQRLKDLIAKNAADRLAWEKAPPSAGALKPRHERKVWRRVRKERA